MRTLKAAAIAAFAIFGMAICSNALAFEGCYAGAHTGVSVSGTTLTPAGTSTSSSNAVTSMPMGIVIGCDMAVTVDKKVFAGLWGEGELYRMPSGAPIFGVLGGGNIDHSFATGARLGYMITPYTGVYGMAGWGWSWETSFNAGALSMSAPSYSGPVVGGGLETKLFRNLNLNLSYLASLNRDESLGPALPAQLKTINDVFRVGLTLRFGETDSIFAPAQTPPLK